MFIQLEQQKEKLEENYEEMRTLAEQLEKSNKTKSQFFSIIAHDLKNPLSAISMYAELFQDPRIFERSEDEIRSMFKSTQKAATTALNLTKNLLDWARTQTNRIEFHPEGVNLKTIIENNIDLVSASIEHKQIDIQWENKSNQEMFLLDRNMIDTIVRNLISNAIKFTPHNGKINITIQKEDQNLFITIQDTGVGISLENQEKLFSIGEKYSTPGTSREPGTGLGLILCHEFIKQHQGEINVQSEPNKGSTFTVRIPQ
jgi:two-component system sensor histidine kinase/response regulator